VDPSTKALLARIERLEAGHRTGGLRAVAAPAVTAPERTPAAHTPAPAPTPAPTPTPEPATRAAAPEGYPARANGATSAAATSAAATSAAAAGAAASAGAAVSGTASPPAAAARVAPAFEAEPDGLDDVADLPPLDLAAAVELWAAVVEQVRDQNKMLAALLKDARPVRVSDRELELAFPPGAAFLKRKAEQEDHRRAAAEALRAVSGHTLALRYELGGEELVQVENDAVLSGEELVQRFLAEFDAQELLDDEDSDNEGEAT
jgi:DNA polymerase-3 subunit gamma/tau